MQKLDALGRATFHHIAPHRVARPTNRELRWFKHIERHGPQSSQLLFELTRGTHRCKDTALRQMQKLRAGGYLRLPPQQRQIERAEFNPYIYDLTRQARDHLVDLGVLEQTIRPTGHWWHGALVSHITSEIDIAARERGVRYIPAHEILGGKRQDLAIPVGRSKLIPDQLFALDYGGRYRAFALEVDRGTEPMTSSSSRKSWKRSIDQYRDVLGQSLYKSQYGLRAQMLVLCVFTSKAKEARFLEMIGTLPGTAAEAFLTTAVAPTRCVDTKSDPARGLFDTPWHRRSGRDVLISVG